MLLFAPINVRADDAKVDAAAATAAGDRGDAADDDCCSTTCQLSIDILIITREP